MADGCFVRISQTPNVVCKPLENILVYMYKTYVYVCCYMIVIIKFRFIRYFPIVSVGPEWDDGQSCFFDNSVFTVVTRVRVVAVVVCMQPRLLLPICMPKKKSLHLIRARIAKVVMKKQRVSEAYTARNHRRRWMYVLGNGDDIFLTTLVVGHALSTTFAIVDFGERPNFEWKSFVRIVFDDTFVINHASSLVWQ